MTNIDAITGSQLMRLWGVSSWIDPGANYYLWDGCCVFAIVKQSGFYDIHVAMDKRRWSECRKAGESILKMFGHHKLRAVIISDRPRVCNYARRMGFGERTLQTLRTVDGRESAFFIMWRDPGEYHGRSN
jgi:hypothetical protein|nr:MAG TPA: hypothetical protein [Caudoviricetes sp.]